MDQKSWTYALIAAFVLFALYRRFRRLFGRQPLQPGRMKVRIGIIAVVMVLASLRGLQAPMLALAGVAGLAIGVALAWFGVRLTKFETRPDGIFYTPNAYIGGVLSALLLGRLVYRFATLYPTLHAVHQQGGDPMDSFQKSPLTAALFAVVVGYYIAYYVGLLMRSASLPPSEAPAVPASPPSGP